ncbi:MAG: hypothetical protein Q7U89_06770 [Coriobacteriia bacterium]|nr:hypothetical protein [Coriobacteriia bacterium]
MDYGRILKRAWSVTWRYRVLWIFGLFAGGVGASGGGGSYPSDTENMQNLDASWAERGINSLQPYLPLIIVVAAVGAIVLLALWIVGIAARGGLIHLVNEAEENRPVRASDGWAAGFRHWIRIFLVELVLYLPFTIIVLAVLGFTIAPLIIALVSGEDPTIGIFSLCGGSVLAFIVIVGLGFVVNLLEMMATRHVVLGLEPAGRSLSMAWADLRKRFKDLFVMWLLTVAIGLAYGFAVGIIGGIFVIVIDIASVGGLWPLAIGIGFLMFLALLVPGAVFGTFSSAIWTVFYRGLTGMDAGAEPVATPAPEAAPTAVMPPPPPPAGLS